MSGAGERTEAPTQRRLDEAHRRGEGLGRSSELTSVATLAAGLLGLFAFLPSTTERLADELRAHMALAAQGASTDTAQLLARTGDAVGLSVVIVLPLALAVVVGGVLGSLAGGGFIVAAGAVRWDSSRLNPFSGLKRLANREALTRLVISLAKLGILVGVSAQVIISRLPDLLALDGAGTGAIGERAAAAMMDLGIAVALLLGGVALADVIIQRRRATGSLKMTREEVRQEAKEQDGDPLLRSARRARARQLAFSRMMDAVATADVVVVNPTRIAVALKYDPGSMRAPRIVARGQRLMAARIRELATSNRVPIVEDIPLARALVLRPVGSEVPAHLYAAVARILVLVARLRAGTVRPAATHRSHRGPNGTADAATLPYWMTGTVS